jgi:hypothetical protein
VSGNFKMERGNSLEGREAEKLKEKRGREAEK